MNDITTNLDMMTVQNTSVEYPAKDQYSTNDRMPALPEHLHSVMKTIVDPFPYGRKEAMAICALPMLGMLGGNARFLYRNNEIHHLGFESFLVATQASGKSALTRLSHDLLSVVYMEDAEVRKKKDEFADEYNAVGEGQEKPRDPHLAIRIMMPQTTQSQFMQNVKDLKGKRAIVIAPEVDSLKKAGNWSRDDGTTERLMFDTELGGQDTKSTKGTSACVPMAVNLVMSGTPMAMKKHYKNTEDGLVTRVALCSFPPDLDEEAEEHARSKANKAKMLDIQKKLMAEPVGDVINIPKLRDVILSWCKGKKKLSDVTGNKSIDTFRKRAAVMGFRTGCLLYLLDGKRVTQKAIDFSLWVSEYVLWNQIKFFGQSMDESIESNEELMNHEVSVNDKKNWVFVQMPTTFTYDTVKALYETQGKKGSGYRTIVSRWIKYGWVEKTSDGGFQKTAEGLKIGEAA